MDAKDKDKKIVILTIFAMILVVIGHSDITNDFKGIWIYKWAYSFHMPLFFFIYGYLFALTIPNVKLQELSLLSFFKKKSIRLLVPFLFINSIIFIIKASFFKDTSMMQHPVALNWDSYFYTTFSAPMGFMWFLPTLFFIFCIVYSLRIIFVKNLTLSRGWYTVCLFCTMVLFYLIDKVIPYISFFQLSSAIHYITFFLLGELYCDYHYLIDSWLRKHWIVIGFLTLIISTSLIVGGILAALCGIVFSVTFAIMLENFCPTSLARTSNFCYVVFLLSYFPQMLIRGPIAHTFPELNQYLLSTISFLSGLLMPLIFGVIYVKLKNKNRVLHKMGILIGL